MDLTRVFSYIQRTNCVSRKLNCQNFSTFKLDQHAESLKNFSYNVKLVSLKSIDPIHLGKPILRLKINGEKENTPSDLIKRGVIIAKTCSLGSSTLGLIMIPILSSRLWEKAVEHPSTLAFAVVANTLLGILTFTPLLLHLLTKRFIVNVFYNPDTKIFTTVHYNFFLRKRALRFRADEVVDAAVAPETKKLWIPLATCFVHSRPLLLSLDEQQYNDKEAFKELTKNINIMLNAD